MNQEMIGQRQDRMLASSEETAGNNGCTIRKKLLGLANPLDKNHNKEIPIDFIEQKR
jgi:hypothetical protein